MWVHKNEDDSKAGGRRCFGLGLLRDAGRYAERSLARPSPDPQRLVMELKQ